MTWKKSDSLINAGLTRFGLSKALTAGAVCKYAESLYPGLFKATSLVDGVLRVQTIIEKQMAFREIEGKLLSDCAVYAKEHSLPIPTRVRLTITREDATI